MKRSYPFYLPALLSLGSETRAPRFYPVRR